MAELANADPLTPSYFENVADFRDNCTDMDVASHIGHTAQSCSMHSVHPHRGTGPDITKIGQLYSLDPCYNPISLDPNSIPIVCFSLPKGSIV